MARLATFMAALLVSFPSAAQVTDLSPNRDPGSIPNVTYTQSFPGSMPEFYSISVDGLGNAAYSSRAGGNPETPLAEPYMMKFTVSSATRDRIFDLAKATNYFEGSFDFTKGNIANTGAKTLAYIAPNQRHQATYNWSQNAAIQELTNLFQGLSLTLEHGRKLTYLHRYDRLGIEAELKRVEQAARDRRLRELQVLAPLLQQLASDSALMRISRARAKRLLEMAGPTSANNSAGHGAFSKQ